MKSVLIKLMTSVALIIISPVIIMVTLFLVWKPRKNEVNDNGYESFGPYYEQLEIMKRRENLQ